jgi:hypothetical protein
MELFTEVILKTERDMDQELRYGLMVQSTKDSGALIKLTVEVNSGMQTEMFMKVSGKMIRQMDMEFMSMSTALNMKDTGVTTCKMEQELNHGVMEVNTRVAIRRV